MAIERCEPRAARSWLTWAWLLGAVLAADMHAPAAEPPGPDPTKATPAEPQAAFEETIAPLLATRCGACHGPDLAESGFRVDLRDRALAGGDSGSKGVVPGLPADSELFRRIEATDPEVRMPADGPPLTDSQRALIRSWIAAGAHWPDTMATIPASLLPSGAAPAVKGLGHWSLEPIRMPMVPEAPVGEAWRLDPPPSAIDAFLAESLARQGLAFNPEADPPTLVRRLSFDLIGLPPTPEEIAAFDTACRDERAATGRIDTAYGALVDRLLASPHHGERWARHWLDVVRFAESDGFETNKARANAWPYRDWVIESLNADLPYDDFLRRQLCGDLCGADAATGFLVGGPVDRVKSPDPVLTATQRADELHDIVSTTGSAFLGLTVGCARCHDHKFDAVPQADYYRLKAVFAGVRHGERPIRVKEDEDRDRQIVAIESQLAPLVRRLDELQPRAWADAFAPVTARFVRFTVLGTTAAEPCIDELEVFAADGRNVARTAKPTASGTFADNPFHRLEHVNDGQYGNRRSWISNEVGRGWVQLELPADEQIVRVVWSRDRSPNPEYRDRLVTRYDIAVSCDGERWTSVASHADRLPRDQAAPDPAKAGDKDTRPAILTTSELSPAERAEYESLSAAVAELRGRLEPLKLRPMAYAGQFGQPEKTFRLFRGDPLAAREEVAPGGLSHLGSALGLTLETPEPERRQALAEWIVSPANPLTPRVIVNRLWHYHFGTGIVDTPSDLGVNGGAPSHRHLLDWLASELVNPANPADRWRLRRIHRLIVMSRAYRQASVARPEALAIDAGSRLLWRFPPRRLEAEPLRDAILAVSGSLDATMGGPGFDLFEPNTNYVKVYVTKTAFTAADFRRMVYQSKPRAELDTFFGAFDCPDAGQVQPSRTVSTTPLQAINMLNGGFLLDQAERFAERVEREAGGDAAAQVARAIMLAFGRPATDRELTAGRDLVRAHGLPLLCRSLYNASEFIMIY